MFTINNNRQMPAVCGRQRSPLARWFLSADGDVRLYRLQPCL